MSDFSLRVQGLGKRYRIGAWRPYRSLRESIVEAASLPFRRLFRPAAPPAEDRTLWALKDVSFEVQPGEIVGVIGGNGAGKSTLLKILSRITDPTEGHAEIRGRVRALLEVGTGFHQELSGRENIYVNGAMLGMRKSEIDRKLDAIVSFADIGKFLDTPVKFYSSGMYVRLAFAVAAHLEPEILLVDEVLAVGDAEFQRKCLGKMGEVTRSGRTVLFVSHNLSAIRQLCTSAFLFRQGRLSSHGPVDAAIRDYLGAERPGTAEVELAAADHAQGGDTLRVNRVRLKNGAGGALAVPWKEPIDLELELEATAFLPHVVVSVGLCTLDGVPLFTVRHTDGTHPPVALEPGRHRIGVRLDNPLREGTYQLILGAHEASARSVLYYVPSSLRLEVLPALTEGQIYHDQNPGLINGEGSWTLPVRTGAP